MAKKTKWTKRDIPPCPDPASYVLVQAAEGPYWRRKRGTVKPAMLNAAFAQNAAHTKIASPAATRILERLRPYLTGLTLRRVPATLAGCLRKALNAGGDLDYRYAEGLDLQPDHPLTNLLLVTPRVSIANGTLRATIDLHHQPVRRHSKLVTHWWAEAILLWGDPAGKALRVDSVESPLYAFEEIAPPECVLELPLPDGGVPWMALLKISCLEGRELALHSRHYGMRVVRVGV